MTDIFYLHMEEFFMLLRYWKKRHFSVESFNGCGLAEAALSLVYLFPLALHHLIGRNLTINTVMCRVTHGALIKGL
jgi:hypothetical protein